MKLTKGKISKLYTKNRQSVKRRKNGKKKTNRSKTFRKKRNINLANKSLKLVNFRKNGGNNILPEYDNIKEGGYRMPYKNSKKSKKNKPLSNESTGIEMTQLDEPVYNPLQNQDLAPQVDNSSVIAPSSEVVSDSLVEVPSSEVVSEPVVPNSSVAPSSEIVSEPVVPDSSVAEVPSSEIGSDSSLVEIPSSEVVSKPVVPDSSVAEVPSSEVVSDSSVVEVPSSEVVSEPVVPDSSVVEVPSSEVVSDSLVEVPSSEVVPDSSVVEVSGPGTEIQQTNPLNEAINTLGIRASEEILKVVSNHLINNISTVTDQIQNGFNANKNAANTIASSGGKRRKTRKFKLTNKNKKTRAKR